MQVDLIIEQKRSVYPLEKRHSLYLPCIQSDNKNSCPNQAKCSCYLDPGLQDPLTDYIYCYIVPEILNKYNRKCSRDYRNSRFPLAHDSCTRKWAYHGRSLMLKLFYGVGW